MCRINESGVNMMKNMLNIFFLTQYGPDYIDLTK